MSYRVEPHALELRMADQAFRGPKSGPQLEYCRKRRNPDIGAEGNFSHEGQKSRRGVRQVDSIRLRGVVLRRRM
jgi:hypothetical protein